MVVADPSSELLDLIRRLGDPAPREAPDADRRAAAMIRRRFGLSLPPPFAGRPGPDEPVRPAVAEDGPAIAAVKWRAFGTNYRGILPDAFLDGREVVPPTSFWTGRAMLPPSRRHRVLVWGRPGTVFGYADCGPAHPDDLAAEPGATAEPPEVGEVGEVYELYVDPAVQGEGGGSRLLDAAAAWLTQAGLERLELSVIEANVAAQDFYRSQGWEPTGRSVPVDLGVVRYVNRRYRRRSPAARP